MLNAIKSSANQETKIALESTISEHQREPLTDGTDGRSDFDRAVIRAYHSSCIDTLTGEKRSSVTVNYFFPDIEYEYRTTLLSYTHHGKFLVTSYAYMHECEPIDIVRYPELLVAIHADIFSMNEMYGHNVALYPEN